MMIILLLDSHAPGSPWAESTCILAQLTGKSNFLRNHYSPNHPRGNAHGKSKGKD
jgi:hypothetical protein